MASKAIAKQHWRSDMLFFWSVAMVVFGAALIASMFTFAGMSSGWYQSLAHASWTPPDWVFSLAWTILYVVLAVAIFLGVREEGLVFGKFNRWVFGALSITGLLLNVGWCMGFFYFESVIAGFVLIALLALIILAQVVFTFVYLGDSRGGRSAGILLTFYLAWLLYATTLNGYLLK